MYSLKWKEKACKPWDEDPPDTSNDVVGFCTEVEEDEVAMGR